MYKSFYLVDQLFTEPLVRILSVMVFLSKMYAMLVGREVYMNGSKSTEILERTRGMHGLLHVDGVIHLGDTLHLAHLNNCFCCPSLHMSIV